MKHLCYSCENVKVESFFQRHGFSHLCYCTLLSGISYNHLNTLCGLINYTKVCRRNLQW